MNNDHDKKTNLEHGSPLVALQDNVAFIMGTRSRALRAHLSRVGGCRVELGLIEDYLLNYSSTASVKQPWIKETSQRQTLESSAAFN